MNTKKQSPDKPSLIQRLRDWLNHHMIHDTRSMFVSLTVFTILVVIILSSILYFFNEEELFPTVWDTFATTINAWMPYSEDGGLLHIIIMAFAALMGILFTSLLIGILTTAVEEKLEDIRTGNSTVIENNHIVIMGLHTGLYRLIRELIMTSKDRKQTIVIAGSEDKTEVLGRIRENVEIPKNIRIRYRKIDVCDPVELEYLSLPTASRILMNNGDDDISVKCMLAISRITKQYQKRPAIVAIIHHESNIPAFREAGKGHNMLTLQSYRLISRLIAHTCIQPGLSFVFEEIFGCEGLDFYFDKIPGCYGMSFDEISQKMKGGIPVGYTDGKRIYLNPLSSNIYRENQQLIYLAEEKNSYQITSTPYTKEDRIIQQNEIVKPHVNVLMIGSDEKSDEICRELSQVHCKVTKLDDIRDITYDELCKLCKGIQHVIILNGVNEDELDDNDIIRTILILKAVREDMNIAFNITAEMFDEKNKELVEDNHMDFIISSDFSNMVMAQIADSPKRQPVFKELLSIQGNEIYTLSLSKFIHEKTEVKCSTLRQLGNAHGYVVIGYRTSSRYHQMLCDPDETITLSPKGDLIIMAKDMEL